MGARGKDEVLPQPDESILSGGTVQSFGCTISLRKTENVQFLLKNYMTVYCPQIHTTSKHVLREYSPEI